MSAQPMRRSSQMLRPTLISWVGGNITKKPSLSLLFSSGLSLPFQSLAAKVSESFQLLEIPSLRRELPSLQRKSRLVWLSSRMFLCWERWDSGNKDIWQIFPHTFHHLHISFQRLQLSCYVLKFPLHSTRRSRKIPGFHVQKSRDFDQLKIPGSRDSRDPVKACWP